MRIRSLNSIFTKRSCSLDCFNKLRDLKLLEFDYKYKSVTSTHVTRTIFTCFSRLAILAFSSSLYGLLNTCPVVAPLLIPDNKYDALGKEIGSFLRC